MQKHSKSRRCKNRRSGKAAVAYHNARNNRISVSRNVQVNMTGKNAHNNVTITPAHQTRKPQPIIIRTPASAVPVASRPVHEKKRKRISPLGWVAIATGAICAVCGVRYAFKKSA